MIQDPYVHVFQILAAVPAPPAGRFEDTWVCPGCGRERPALSAWRVVVGTRSGPAHTHRVRLCAVCISDLIRAGQLQLRIGDTEDVLARAAAAAGDPASSTRVLAGSRPHPPTVS